MSRVLGAIELFASLSLGLVTLVTFVSVVLRYCFNTALPDAFDIVKLCQGVALAWGIALASAHRSHIAVDISWSWLGPRVAAGIEMVGNIVSVAFLIVLSWVMMGRALKSLASGLATAELRVPVWPANVLIASGICCAALLAIVAMLTAKGRKT